MAKRRRGNATQTMLAETLRMQARLLALLEFGERRRERSRSRRRYSEYRGVREQTAPRRAYLRARSDSMSPPPKREGWKPRAVLSARWNVKQEKQQDERYFPKKFPPVSSPFLPPPPPPPSRRAAFRPDSGAATPAQHTTEKADRRAVLSARWDAGDAAYLRFMDQRFTELMDETLWSMSQQQDGKARG